MLKLSQINEGLWNKGLNRSKTGEVRKELLDGLSQEEFKIYDILNKWFEQIDIRWNNIRNRADCYFEGNWEEFQTELFNNLDKTNSKKIRNNIDSLKSAIENNYGVIYVIKSAIGVERCLHFVGFLDNKQTSLTIHYFAKDNIDFIINSLYQKYNVNVNIHTSDKIFVAYAIPHNVFEKIMRPYWDLRYSSK